MKARSMSFATTSRIILMLSTLVLAAAFSSTSNAAEGCGYGFHRSMYGGCIGNHPGAYATPAYGRPGCWRNAWGQLRCN